MVKAVNWPKVLSYLESSDVLYVGVVTNSRGDYVTAYYGTRYTDVARKVLHMIEKRKPDVGYYILEIKCVANG